MKNRRSARRLGLVGVLAQLLASCASPPLTLYTLAETPVESTGPNYGPRPLVIGIAHVGIPDELDNDEILMRDGNILRRSSKGRWAGRLSLEITDLITQHLAEQRPDALVTDRPQIDQPAYRLTVNVSRLVVTSDGTAQVAADWQILPRDPALPLTRYHTRISENGPVGSDELVVALEKTLLGRLADSIDLRMLR